MVSKNILSLGLVLCISAYSSSSFTASTDEDGCFEGGDRCISMSSKWRDSRLTSYFKNVCNERMYVRFCNKRKNGNSDCGADGLRPGVIYQIGIVQNPLVLSL